MRLSFTVLACHSFILFLLTLSILMEVPAWLNDRNWNDMKDVTAKRFTFKQFEKCSRAFMNGTVRTLTISDHSAIFDAKKRDLPFETYFMGLCGVSLIMYLMASVVYLCWKRIMPNIYISIVANLVGFLLHSAAFSLILSSTVIYSEKHRHYMGADVCYNFKCEDCPEDSEYQERIKHLFYNARYCLEKLNVCQMNWLKDRIVYLLLGCIIASSIAFISSIRRQRRHSKRNPNHSKKMSLDSEDLVLIRPSMKSANDKLSLPDATVINSLLAEDSP